MPLQMGAYHMIGVDDWEPQRTNNFEVVFPNLDDLVTVHTNSQITNSASDLLTLSVKSVSYPSTEIGKLQVSYGNNSINFAGKPSYTDVTIVVNDFIGIQTEKIIMAWSRLVYDPNTQLVGMASNYKRSGYLYEYSPDGTRVRTVKLFGAFPGNVSPGDFSNDDNSIREISCTFYVDYAMPLDV